MNIKTFLDKITNFLLNRLSELVGMVILVTSILLFVSLISYSPEDPNFIFPENTNIKNLLGIKGSYTADILYQSIGLISLLIPISLIFLSISIILNKKILQIIECLFFIIIYSIFGTLFFTVFHSESYWLTINGNNGYVGSLFVETFLINLINLNFKISYIILVFLIFLFFLLSINFKIKYLSSIKKIFTKSINDPNKSLNEISNENLKSEDNYINNETRVQENFPFTENVITPDKKNIKYKLPSLDFLKKPTRKDKNLSQNKIDEKL